MPKPSQLGGEPQPDEAAAFLRLDDRSELACDAFRCCCCTLLLYSGLERCDQIFELWSLNWCGAMGIRTPDLLHAMNLSRVPPPGHMRLDPAIR